MKEILANFILPNSDLFKNIEEETANYLKSKMLRKTYSKKETLFKEGGYPRGIYILKKGKIKIYRNNPEGKQTVFYIYRKGDFFGYRPLLASEKHPATAAAMDNCVVSFIPKEYFLKALYHSAALSELLLKNLSKEFSVWLNRMTSFTQLDVKKRIILSLLILNEIYNKEPGSQKKSTIRISRDDFAGFAGTVKETLVRNLRTFKDQGIITTRGSLISIIKVNALHKMLL